jgi:hypothetical protein
VQGGISKIVAALQEQTASRNHMVAVAADKTISEVRMKRADLTMKYMDSGLSPNTSEIKAHKMLPSPQPAAPVAQCTPVATLPLHNASAMYSHTVAAVTEISESEGESPVKPAPPLLIGSRTPSTAPPRSDSQVESHASEAQATDLARTFDSKCKVLFNKASVKLYESDALTML